MRVSREMLVLAGLATSGCRKDHGPVLGVLTDDVVRQFRASCPTPLVETPTGLTCHADEHSVFEYEISFDDAKHLDFISFWQTDNNDQVLRTFDRVFAPIVPAGCRDQIRASIESLSSVKPIHEMCVGDKEKLLLIVSPGGDGKTTVMFHRSGTSD